MHQLVLVFHALVALALIGLVLIQHGKGADVGASFGSGASQTVFGSRGSTSFLVKLTSILAAIFFATSLALGYMASSSIKQRKASLLDVPAVQSVPTQTADLPQAPAANTSTKSTAKLNSTSADQTSKTKKKQKEKITETTE